MLSAESFGGVRALGEESWQMWDLNKRLEAYLARVKFLEEENEMLQAEIQEAKGSPAGESWREKYEEELRSLRDALDLTFREKSTAELARDNLSEEMAEVRSRWQKEQAAREEAKKLLSLSKKELEEERRAQIWLKERALQLEKEVENLLEVHEEEKARLEQELGSFSQSLEPFRGVPGAVQALEVEDYSRRFSEIWKGAVETYKAEVSQLEGSLCQAKENLWKAVEENQESQGQLRHLEKELVGLKARKEMLEENLGRRWQEQHREAEKFLLALEALEQEKQNLRGQIAQVLEERQQLMHLKMSLSLEVATYRTLLEAESSRLQLPPGEHKVPHSFRDLKLEMSSSTKLAPGSTKPRQLPPWDPPGRGQPPRPQSHSLTPQSQRELQKICSVPPSCSSRELSPPSCPPPSSPQPGKAPLDPPSFMPAEPEGFPWPGGDGDEEIQGLEPPPEGVNPPGEEPPPSLQLPARMVRAALEDALKEMKDDAQPKEDPRGPEDPPAPSPDPEPKPGEASRGAGKEQDPSEGGGVESSTLQAGDMSPPVSSPCGVAVSPGSPEEGPALGEEVATRSSPKGPEVVAQEGDRSGPEQVGTEWEEPEEEEEETPSTEDKEEMGSCSHSHGDGMDVGAQEAPLREVGAAPAVLMESHPVFPVESHLEEDLGGEQEELESQEMFMCATGLGAEEGWEQEVSPEQEVSLEQEMSPEQEVSPRQEMSPEHMSLEQEMSPRQEMSPEQDTCSGQETSLEQEPWSTPQAIPAPSGSEEEQVERESPERGKAEEEEEEEEEEEDEEEEEEGEEEEEEEGEEEEEEEAVGTMLRGEDSWAGEAAGPEPPGQERGAPQEDPRDLQEKSLVAEELELGEEPWGGEGDGNGQKPQAGDWEVTAEDTEWALEAEKPSWAGDIPSRAGGLEGEGTESTRAVELEEGEEDDEEDGESQGTSQQQPPAAPTDVPKEGDSPEPAEGPEEASEVQEEEEEEEEEGELGSELGELESSSSIDPVALQGTESGMESSMREEEGAGPLEEDIEPSEEDIGPSEEGAGPLEEGAGPLEEDIGSLEEGAGPLEEDIGALEEGDGLLEGIGLSEEGAELSAALEQPPGPGRTLELGEMLLDDPSLHLNQKGVPGGVAPEANPEETPETIPATKNPLEGEGWLEGREKPPTPTLPESQEEEEEEGYFIISAPSQELSSSEEAEIPEDFEEIKVEAAEAIRDGLGGPGEAFPVPGDEEHLEALPREAAGELEVSPEELEEGGGVGAPLEKSPMDPGADPGAAGMGSLEGPESLEEPVGSESLEEPMGSGSLEEPVGSESLEEPMGSKSLEEPMGSESLEEPIGPGSLEESVGSEILEEPMGSESLEEPMGSGSLEEPVGSESLEEPVGSETLEEPMGSESLEEPVGSETLEEPMGSESLEEPMGSESLQEPIGSGSLEESVGSEILGEPVGSETLEEPMGSGSLEEPMGSGSLEEPMGSEILEEPMGSEILEGPVGSEGPRKLEGWKSPEEAVGAGGAECPEGLDAGSEQELRVRAESRAQTPPCWEVRGGGQEDNDNDNDNDTDDEVANPIPAAQFQVIPAPPQPTQEEQTPLGDEAPPALPGDRGHPQAEPPRPQLGIFPEVSEGSAKVPEEIGKDSDPLGIVEQALELSQELGGGRRTGEGTEDRDEVRSSREVLVGPVGAANGLQEGGHSPEVQNGLVSPPQPPSPGAAPLLSPSCLGGGHDPRCPLPPVPPPPLD